MSWRPAAFVLVLAGAAALVLPGVANAQSAERDLAEKYAPVVRLVEQVEECGHGESYEPIDVEVVLGSEDVALRGPWSGGGIVEVAPTARDLATGKYEYHLDFPGDALNPGCSYEKWSRRLTGRPPTMYARVVAEESRPDKLALQYWFFYVFNDFNNKHEGDWEMIQLVFDATSAAEALTEDPTSIGFSQHSGAEAATWGDDKLELVEGTHPVVYPAAGSHANYFEPALYLGRSAAEGVGCDDTTGPSRDLRPRLAFVPTATAEYERQYPWLAFQGRWGEKQPSFYNGPTGPNDKRQWREPISWADDKFREKSYAIPAGGLLGSDATDFFCAAVAGGSNLLTAAAQNPASVVLVLLGLTVLAIWALSRTQWSPSAPLHVDRRRAWGQLLSSSVRMYGLHWRLFALIGLGFIPVAVVILVLQAAILSIADLGLGPDGESDAIVAAVAFGIALLFTLIALTLVQALTARAMADLDVGTAPSVLGTYRTSVGSVGPLVGALMIAAVVVVLLNLVIIGVPIAVWLLVRWALLAQVIVLEGEHSVGALRRSGKLVQGHWLRVASIVAVTSIVLLVGPLLGGLLILVTSASFVLVNLIAGLVYAAVMPFVAIATTYLYYDLRVREQQEAKSVSAGDVLPAELV